MRVSFVAAMLILLVPRADAAIVAQEAPEPVRLVEELRIGTLDGAMALMAIHTAALSSDGRLLFVQQRPPAVKVFDASSGELVRTFGRAGEGPGEFVQVSYLSVQGDTLFAADRRQQRLSLFTFDGTHLRTERIASSEVPGATGPTIPLLPAPEGLVWGEALLRLGTTMLPLVLMRRDGDIVRVVAERLVERGTAQASGGGRVFAFMQPFAGLDHQSAFAPDGSAVALVEVFPGDEDRGAFVVMKVDAAGDTVYARRFRYDRIPVTTAQRDSIHYLWATRFAGADEPRSDLGTAREHVRVPEYLPPISEVLLGADGRVWLRRESLSAPTATWLILDPSGHPTAAATLPRKARLLLAERDHAWAMVTDDLDVPYLVRYRIHHPPP
ncbi:MAG: hypothetical protein KY466_00715 [Gemmatimonadetes bacterium]|nr:hypothetical protein [Gemmatimonadota bacterium]